ncbi:MULTISPECIES: hypothetical protein [Rhodococcus]|uniref:hypothetical protein n=1 Tax=Rhodococcus TaxID=1827 RepID=UPI00071DC182|nr:MULTISPECIES: hypothetical protein [Rhodococcus]KSU82835.1 hypothetical protein AS032_00245 [Rhodococcus qingshengii]MBP2524159.1 hypothetical protein [Rhodococcus sp. PvP104]MDA3636340.1 hypothetical protein [Rhodococcus sp. C-2]SCB73911.1 hypothetical protein GA0061093_10153 [Rhodococcus qingshengii]
MSTADRTATLTAIDVAMLGGGFKSIGSSLVVAGVPFDVIASYVGGPGSLDLIVVVDATEGTSEQLQRGYWLVERVARALDQVGSRRPLTAIILHDHAAARVPTEDFLRLARVLLITHPDHVQRELAPILPLVFETGSEIAHDSLDELLERNQSGNDVNKRTSLIEAAQRGAEQVESEFREWLDQVFGEGRTQ